MKTLFNKGVRILKEDKVTGLIALYKPVGLKSHPNTSSDNQSLLTSCIYDHKLECYVDNNNKKIFLINRLDSVTSGIILISDKEATAISVRKEFSKRTVQKKYKALVFGSENSFTSKRIKWSDNISIDHSGNKLRALSSTSNNSHLAISYVNLEKKVADAPSILLINLVPLTGFTHQLRVQCAQHGLPIVCDKIYGNFILNKLFDKNASLNRRMYLHSYSIQVNYEIDSKLYQFFCESPLKDEPGFNKIINSDLTSSE